MKVTLTNLSINFLQDYSLKKEIDNNFIKESIASTLIYQGDDHKYLAESAVSGDDKDTGTIYKECIVEGTVTPFEKEVYIKHNEGKFDLQRCITEKKLSFVNPLDCVTQKEINIFDYPAGETQTIQGDLIREDYGAQLFYFIGDNESGNDLKLQQALDLLGGIPDKSGEGLFPEYISVTAIPIEEEQNDPTYGKYYQYVHHDLQLYVSYVGITSATQYSTLWRPFVGGFYYSGFSTPEWGASNHTTQTIFDLNTPGYFTLYNWSAGTYKVFKDVPISNTVAIIPILEDIFECSGLQVVSNFLNINPDGTNPANRYYKFAEDNCYNIKIVQSYDIIRESALEDSFGKSGLIKSKDFIADICLAFNLLCVPDLENLIMRIEHVSYYTTKGIDVTGFDYEFAPLELNRDQIDAETFSFAQPTPTEGFFEIKITYDNLDLYKEPNDKQYKSKLFVTDVFGLLNNKKYEQDQYKKLFFLLTTDGDNIIGLNSAFSIENLVINLHDLHRPMKSGKIKGVVNSFSGYSIGFSGEVKFLSDVITWNKVWPLMSAKTKYGTFLIESSEIDKNDLLTLKIKK